MTWVAEATGRPPGKFLHDIEPAGGSVRYRCQMKPLKISYNREQSLAVMESRIKLAARKGALRILEAGCGTIWPLRLEGVEYQLTGVDVDRDALAVRQRTARPTDRLMYGDLRTRELFAAEEFDAIYNSFVLEHVDGAERVLDNFMYWLKPGGTLILRIPDGDSVYGFVTRMTPFWFHVLIKKYVQKLPNAGKPGYDPFPVFYDDVVSRRGIHRYCADRGCKVHDEAGWGSYLPKHGLLAALQWTFVRIVSLLSLNKLDWRYNNLTFVIEKLPRSVSIAGDDRRAPERRRRPDDPPSAVCG
jgi:SAM-dependent methyltransferase